MVKSVILHEVKVILNNAVQGIIDELSSRHHTMNMAESRNLEPFLY